MRPPGWNIETVEELWEQEQYSKDTLDLTGPNKYLLQGRQKE